MHTSAECQCWHPLHTLQSVVHELRIASGCTCRAFEKGQGARVRARIHSSCENAPSAFRQKQFRPTNPSVKALATKEHRQAWPLLSPPQHPFKHTTHLHFLHVQGLVVCCSIASHARPGPVGDGRASTMTAPAWLLRRLPAELGAARAAWPTSLLEDEVHDRRVGEQEGG